MTIFQSTQKDTDIVCVKRQLRILIMKLAETLSHNSQVCNRKIPRECFIRTFHNEKIQHSYTSTAILTLFSKKCYTNSYKINTFCILLLSTGQNFMNFMEMPPYASRLRKQQYKSAYPLIFFFLCPGTQEKQEPHASCSWFSSNDVFGGKHVTSRPRKLSHEESTLPQFGAAPPNDKDFRTL